MPLRSK